MSQPYLIRDVVEGLPAVLGAPLPAPAYTGATVDHRAKVGLAVESMRSHMTDEGWQIFAGLEHAGYVLAGDKLVITLNNGRAVRGLKDVEEILKHLNPGTLVVQDKREWDLGYRDFRDPSATFTNVGSLRRRNDLFKLTILKDAQQRPAYHAESAAEMGVHAWVVYYHPALVTYLAPYTRCAHLIRTYHTVDAALVPAYQAAGRHGCLLSGASSGAYPLRQRLIRALGNMPDVHYKPHPGYHRKGCETPQFLQILSHYKVALCTASRYGYALRKIIEATACGCVVVTDLPADEVLPEIDGNLVRVHNGATAAQVYEVVRRAIDGYDPSSQERYAQAAKAWYDYRIMSTRLADNIEHLRMNYSQAKIMAV